MLFVTAFDWWCASDRLKSGKVQAYSAEAGGKELFPTMSRLGWKRRASLGGLTADPFHLTLSYPSQPPPPGLGEGGVYATFEVSGLQAVLQKHQDVTDIVARFVLDNDGFAAVTSVDAVRLFNETQMVSKQVPDDSPGVQLCSYHGFVHVESR